MALFVGKDFLSRDPPPGYKPGIGRGAVGFSTSAERITDFPAKKAKSVDRLEVNAVSKDRFANADIEAEEIYANVEKQIRRKKRRPNFLGSKETASVNGATATTSIKPPAVSIEELAALPEASDLTLRHKRLRAEEQALKRTYKVELDPGKLGANELNASHENSKIDLNKRDQLQLMIRRQPTNPQGYIQLASLEESELRLNAARRIASKGCEKCTDEVLWLLNISLHSQLDTKVSGAKSRELAAIACKAIPDSTSLWDLRVQLESTVIGKLQIVHDALMHCPNHTQFWLLAADLEDKSDQKKEVLRTALEFTESSKVYLALADLEPENRLSLLKEARKKYSNDRDVWLQSVKSDPNLSLDALEFIERSYFLNSLLLTCGKDIGVALANKLDLTASEQLDLAKKVDWLDSNLTESAMVSLVAQDLTNVDAALRQFPQSASVWKLLLRKGDTSKLVSVLNQYKPPECFLRQVIDKLNEQTSDSEIALKWLKTVKDENPLLCVSYLKKKGPTLAEVENAIKKWPQSAELYILLASVSQSPEQALRDGLNKATDSSAIWLELVKAEPSTIKKRAILSQALIRNPRSADLWIFRINLEKSQGLLGEHLITEALRQLPDNGPLWVHRIELAPPSQRKLWVSKALKETHLAEEVLEFGIKFFESIGQHSQAEKWQILLDSKQDL